MPIYAYRCESCGFSKDVLQKVSDPALEQCPACGQATFRKTLSAPAFQLKGSGWYVTDFRDNGSAKRPKDAAESAGDGGKPGADKSGDEAGSRGGSTADSAGGTSSGASGGTNSSTSGGTQGGAQGAAGAGTASGGSAASKSSSTARSAAE